MIDRDIAVQMWTPMLRGKKGKWIEFINHRTTEAIIKKSAINAIEFYIEGIGEIGYGCKPEAQVFKAIISLANGSSFEIPLGDADGEHISSETFLSIIFDGR